MEITLTLQNKDEIMRVFKQAPGIASREYRTSLERIAARVQSNAMHNSPVGKYKNGGNLRQSIKTMPYGSTGFIVTVNAHYGIYVDQGTKPHVILPKRAKVLSWLNGSGQRVFSKRVNHPGTRPTYFFTNAVKDAESYANVEMSDAMDRTLRQL
jgi:hypothetical protein